MLFFEKWRFWHPQSGFFDFCSRVLREMFKTASRIVRELFEKCSLAGRKLEPATSGFVYTLPRTDPGQSRDKLKAALTRLRVFFERTPSGLRVFLEGGSGHIRRLVNTSRTSPERVPVRVYVWYMSGI